MERAGDTTHKHSMFAQKQPANVLSIGCLRARCLLWHNSSRCGRNPLPTCLCRWLAQNASTGLTEANVLDYFALSEWYDKTCLTGQLKMHSHALGGMMDWSRISLPAFPHTLAAPRPLPLFLSAFLPPSKSRPVMCADAVLRALSSYVNMPACEFRL